MVQADLRRAGFGTSIGTDGPQPGDELGVLLDVDVGVDSGEDLVELCFVHGLLGMPGHDAHVDILDPVDDEVVLPGLPIPLLGAPGSGGLDHDVLLALALGLLDGLHVLLQHLDLVVGGEDGDRVLVNIGLDLLQVPVQFCHSFVQG